MFASSTARIEAANTIDDRDYIELTFDRPLGEEAVVVVSLRNSLLTTVLFYDMMLDPAGAGAIDWIGQDMARIQLRRPVGTMVPDSHGAPRPGPQGGRLGRCRTRPRHGSHRLGGGGRARPGSGRGARARAALVLQRRPGGSIGSPWLRPPRSRARPASLPTRLEQEEPTLPTNALELIADPDDAYLATYPGTSAWLEFETASSSPGHGSFVPAPRVRATTPSGCALNGSATGVRR